MKKILFTGFMASILSIAGAYAVADNDGYLTTKSYVDDAAMWATKQGDWNATSGQKGYIANKPTIPTSTSQLTNNSGFITSADVPEQVQADWNATEGMGVIANKPTLAAVATSGSYNSLTDTPTIPTSTSQLTNNSGFITSADVPEQVQADWNATTGVSAIANKPTLADVATTGSYNSLTDTPDIPTSIADLGMCTGGTACVIDNTGALVPVDTIDTWVDL